jgi:hypothetical protein
MFAGRSMGKAFRPSRFSTDLEPLQQPESPLERELRIRAYARRARLRLPVFQPQTAGADGGRMAASA